MSKLNFIPTRETDINILDLWFEDQELQYRYSRPTQEWFEYVRNQPDVHAWMIYENDIPIGHLQLDTKIDNTGHIGFFVKPDLRHQGYGKCILRTLLERPEVSNLDQIEGGIEFDNIASRRCVESVGFVQQNDEPDEEGMLTYIYSRSHLPENS